jgi:phytoene dehydrogenase-like protein
VSMVTQWVPHTWNAQPHREELEAYADRLVARMDGVAPGFTDSVLHRQVIGPYEMEHSYGLIGGNIFHGELNLGQMFHARPAAGTPICEPPYGASTRPDRPRTAAAASPASPAATSSTRSSPIGAGPG